MGVLGGVAFGGDDHRAAGAAADRAVEGVGVRVGEGGVRRGAVVGVVSGGAGGLDGGAGVHTARRAVGDDDGGLVAAGGGGDLVEAAGAVDGGVDGDVVERPVGAELEVGDGVGG